MSYGNFQSYCFHYFWIFHVLWGPEKMQPLPWNIWKNNKFRPFDELTSTLQKNRCFENFYEKSPKKSPDSRIIKKKQGLHNKCLHFRKLEKLLQSLADRIFSIIFSGSREISHFFSVVFSKVTRKSLVTMSLSGKQRQETSKKNHGTSNFDAKYFTTMYII